MLLLGLGTTFASDKKGEKNSNDNVLYEQAVKAIKDKKFVFKGDLYEDKSRQCAVDSKRNFVILEEEKVTVQVYESPQNSWAIEGRPSNFKMRTNKTGDVNFEMLLKNKGNSLKLKFSMKENGNKCILRAIPINFHTGFTLSGEIMQYNVSDLVRTNILQIFQVE